jgi:large subunit ribosomal protein L20
LFRQATEAVDRAMRMATIHRRMKKREYRALWIARLSAACRQNGITYSRFVHGLDKANIGLNRKMMSEIAIHDPEGFAAIVEQATAALS